MEIIKVEKKIRERRNNSKVHESKTISSQSNKTDSAAHLKVIFITQHRLRIYLSKKKKTLQKKMEQEFRTAAL